MDNIIVFLSTIIVPLFGYFLAYVGVILTIRKTTSHTIKQDRLDKVIAPVFLLIEPYLYKDVTDEKVIYTLNLATEIMSQNKFLCGYRLYENLNILNKPTQVQYNNFCKALEKEYDKLCIDIGIPVRDNFYRLRNNQNYSPYKLIMYVIMQLIILIVLVLFVLFYVASLQNYIIEIAKKPSFSSALVSIILAIPIGLLIYKLTNN